MPEKPGFKQVTRLVSEIDRSLRFYLRAARPQALELTAAPGSPRRAEWLIEALMAALAGHAGDSSDRAAGDRGPADGTMFPGNERSIRALAKEIKRLIAEDKRRGLDV